MGVYISMDILPNEIDSKEWEAVYEESLELIRAYPFLSREVDRDTYEETWVYALRGDERELENDQKGWHVFGDYQTMQGAESFILYRNIENYRKSDHVSEGCRDVLAELINLEVFYNQKERQLPIDSVRVFNGKTQGLPHHNYLLAIVCLFESRFPEQVVVSGDISIGQMNQAVKWANTILQKPIQITERIDNGKLLKRISRIVGDEYDALSAFISLTLQAEDFALGKIIREQFSEEVIRAYYIEQFKQYDVSMIGFRNTLSSFFNLGFHVEEACDICVLDHDGCRYDAQEFAETVLSMNWNDGKSRVDDELLAYNQPEREMPETIYSQMGKTFFKMAGLQESMKSSMSSEEVTAILADKLGELVNLESFGEAGQDESDNGNKDSIQELLSKFIADYEEKVESDFNEYTVSDIDDLILWKQGDSLHPNIEKLLIKLKDFTINMMERNKDIFDEFNGDSENNKVRRLIRLNRYFLIRKECWDYYIEHINQTNLVNAVLSILSVKAEGVHMNSLCQAVVNNRSLLEKYIL